MLVKPTPVRLTAPVVLVLPLWLRLPNATIVTDEGAPAIPATARLPPENRFTSPDGALTLALPYRLPAWLSAMPLPVTLIEAAVSGALCPMVPAAVALNALTLTAPPRLISPPLLAVRLKPPPLTLLRLRPPLPPADRRVLPVRLALPSVRLLAAVRLPDSAMVAAPVKACAVIALPLTAPAMMLSPNRLTVAPGALTVPVVRVPLPLLSCTPLPPLVPMVPLLVTPVPTNCTRPLALVVAAWLRLPPDVIVTVVGVPAMPDGKARLPVECSATAPPAALSTALLMALPV